MAPYVSKNAAGEIARLNRRIEGLKRRDARPVSAPVRIGDAVVTEDREPNRVQIRFDGIPTKEMRSSLRARGFVWAPSVGVWQRKLNDNASWAAKQVLRDHYGPNAVQAPATSPQPEPTRQPGDDHEDDDGMAMSWRGIKTVPFGAEPTAKGHPSEFSMLQPHRATLERASVGSGARRDAPGGGAWWCMGWLGIDRKMEQAREMGEALARRVLVETVGSNEVRLALAVLREGADANHRLVDLCEALLVVPDALRKRVAGT